jgi:outer membrane protein TolC
MKAALGRDIVCLGSGIVLLQNPKGCDYSLILPQEHGHTERSETSNTGMKAKALNVWLFQQFSAHSLLLATLIPLASTASAQLGAPSIAPRVSTSTSTSRQTTPPPPPNPGTTLDQQSPLLGSVPQGKATDQEIPLSIMEAIDRGLKYNLALLLNQDATQAARAQRLRALSDLLPNVTGGVQESVQQINLRAFGLSAPGIEPIVGPFGLFDVRGSVAQSLVDLKALNTHRAADQRVRSADFTFKNARELVVLAVGSTYLQTVANMSRVEAAESEVRTADALYRKAVDMQKAGVSARIDPLRSQVELQTRQQQLIVAQNDLAKSKLTLARIIGLPIAQPYALTDRVPFQPLAALDFEAALTRAYGRRNDFLSAQAELQAAELAKRAAASERIPTVVVNGDYGDIGPTPGNSHGTFTLAGTLKFPIFDGGRIKSNVEEADATLKQRRSELEDLRARIEFEVRTALLDVQAAAKQVEVAQSNLALANETLTEAQDRFTAGVTDNLEVIQAQDSVASANENFINSVYSHNVAKVTLARALGIAEDAVRQYLGGKK